MAPPAGASSPSSRRRQAQAGDCDGAKALLDEKYVRSVTEDYYCSGDAKQRPKDVQLENSVFTDFRTAGASVEFHAADGASASIFMSFTEVKTVYIDAVYI